MGSKGGTWFVPEGGPLPDPRWCVNCTLGWTFITSLGPLKVGQREAPHRTMWSVSLWTRDRGFAPPVGHAPRRSGSEERPRTSAVRCAVWCVNCTLE